MNRNNRHLTAKFIARIAVAIIISTVVLAPVAKKFIFTVESTARIKEYSKGQTVHGGWRFEEKLVDANNTVHMVFSTPEGRAIEVHFSLESQDKPYYRKVENYYIRYKSTGPIEGPDEAALNNIIDDIIRSGRANEQNTENPTDRNLPTLYLRIGILLLLMLLLFIVLFDLSFKIFKEKTEGGGNSVVEHGPAAYKKTGPPGLPELVPLGLLLLIFGLKISDYPWDFLMLGDILYFPSHPHNISFSHYILTDTGFPSLPYRAVLWLLAGTRSMTLIRTFNLLMNAATLLFTYAVSRRYVRATIAWIIPLLLLTHVHFEYTLYGLRGYSFFILFVVLSFYTISNFLEDPRPATGLLWAICHIIMLASNPITIITAVGPLTYYLFFRRKSLSPRQRRMADVHSVFLLASAAMLAPIILSAVLSHAPGDNALKLPVEMFGLVLKKHVFHTVLFAPFLWYAFVFRNDFRSALFISVPVGALCVFTLMSPGILVDSNKYFLFLLPFDFICIAIIVEQVLLRLETFKPRLATIVSVAGPILLAAAILLNQISGFRPRAPEYRNISESLPVAVSFLDKIDTDTPVLIYTPEYFLYIIFKKYNLDLFESNPWYGPEMKHLEISLEQESHSFMNFHTFFFPDLPEKFFPGPLWIFRYEVHLFRFPSLMEISSRCELKKAQENLSVWYCPALE